MATQEIRKLNSLRPSFKHYFLLTFLGMQLMLVSGCVSTSFVKVRHRNQNSFPFLFNKNEQDPELQISELTRNIINEEKLDTGLAFNRSRQISHLEKSYKNAPSIALAQSLAELHYVSGNKAELINKKQAQESYLKSIIYSHHFFFDNDLNNDKEPSEEQLFHVRNIYNKSLEKYMRIVCKKKIPFVNRHFTIKNGNSSFKVSITPENWSWKPDELDHYEFVSDYEVKGIQNIHKTTGLGVPLIAVRKKNASDPDIEKHLPRGVSFPITAFMHLDKSQGDDLEDIHCKLVLYDPYQKRVVTVDDKEVTLETDLTTPLAFFMQNSQMKGVDHLGLIRPDLAQKIAGIYMLRPYQKDKIPVLMIHGVWSSPQTWLEAYNDLQASPDIEEKYQFWFYLYPSGKPFIETAADLREDLKEMREKFDPEHQNTGLDNMVLVGHSMGGLIAKAVTVESGEKYWNEISKVPLESIKTSEKNRNQIKRVLFFNSNSSINRIITVATPHRGSRFSNGPTRWLIRRMVTLPKDTLELSKSVLMNNPGAFRDSKSLTRMTSVDSLTPDSKILNILRRTEYSEGVKHHNIVGVQGLSDTDLSSEIIRNKKLASSAVASGEWKSKSDGVVSYDSAHVENADSELVVSAGHSQVQKHKDTISEIHRILIEHLDELKYKNGILPVNGTVTTEPGDIEFPNFYQSQSQLSKPEKAIRRHSTKPSFQTNL